MKGPGGPLGTLRSQVQLLVGALILLLLVSAIGTLLVQQQVTSTQHHLRKMIRPAQVAVAKLGEAYVDEETGARGYQLTGYSLFLEAYNAGRSDAARLLRQLRIELADDSRSQRRLADVSHAAGAWRTKAALLEINQRQETARSHQAVLRQALTGRHLFDALRARLADLAARVNQLAAAEVAAINSAQATANWLTIAAGIVALFLLVVSALMLRNSLSRPLTRLVAQVRRVAEGDLGHSVDVRGPRELSTVARAVETMRVRILAQTARAMELQRQLDLADESERIAGGLHDVVIRRLSGAGLILQSTAGRHPSAASALSGAVDEIDKAIRELRTVIFGLTAGRSSGLRNRVLNLVSECETSLGFTPQLQFEGVPGAGVHGKVADELIAALREFLSQTARHPHASEAEIKINLAEGLLQLRVTDNRRAPPGQTPADTSALDSLSGRAELLGGTCTIERRPGGGTAVEWAVPANGSPGGTPV